MAIEKIQIDRFLELAKIFPVLDVRSPGEYNHAHIPVAHNLPLFTDKERKVVGTAYKQQNREAAIKIGLDYFGPKMRSMVEFVEGLIRSQESATWKQTVGISIDHPAPVSELPSPNSRLVLLHCWRGGMRSAAIAWLLDLYGFKVYTLAGGYKKFRHWVADTFTFPFSFNILGGYTGSGKTYVLEELAKNGDAVVNLERLANHKGSAFGNIGMPEQPTQEMFENLLAIELRSRSGYIDELAPDSFGRHRLAERDAPLPALDSTIWLEDESQRIGRINIPQALWNNMRQSPIYFIDIPFEERLTHIVKEYGVLDKDRMAEAIVRIQKRLGGQETKSALQYLTEGNIEACFSILLKYYDKWYSKGLHNRDELPSLLTTVDCKSVNARLNADSIAKKELVIKLAEWKK